MKHNGHLLQPGQQATVQFLNCERTPVDCLVESTGGRNIIFRSQESLPVDASIKINLPDAMLLAEIKDCRWNKECFSAEIRVMHALPKLSDIGKLVATVMGDRQSVSPVQFASSVAL